MNLVLQGLKTGLAVILLGFLITSVYSLLPTEFSIYPLSEWQAICNQLVSFLNGSLGLFSGFFDIDLLLIFLKLAFYMYILGWSIKLVIWVINFINK